MIQAAHLDWTNCPTLLYCSSMISVATCGYLKPRGSGKSSSSIFLCPSPSPLPPSSPLSSSLLLPSPSLPLSSPPTDHLASILCFLFFPRWPCLQPKLHNSPYQLQATCMNIPGQTGHLSSRSHSELSRVPFRTWRLPQDYLPCLSFWAWEISTSRYQLKLQMEALYSPGLSCHALTASAGIMD